MRALLEQEWRNHRRARDVALMELHRAREATTVGDAKWFLNRWHSSAARPRALIEVFNLMFAPRRDAGECFWRWIMEEWEGFDRIPHAHFERLFLRYRDAWSADYMSADVRSVYNNLPARIVAFRGQDRTQYGLSWTLDRGVAHSFA